MPCTCTRGEPAALDAFNPMLLLILNLVGRLAFGLRCGWPMSAHEWTSLASPFSPSPAWPSNGLRLEPPGNTNDPEWPQQLRPQFLNDPDTRPMQHRGYDNGIACCPARRRPRFTANGSQVSAFASSEGPRWRSGASSRPGRDTTDASDTIFATGDSPAVVDTEVVDAGPGVPRDARPHRALRRRAKDRHDGGAGWAAARGGDYC